MSMANERPHNQSKTAEPCTCDALEDAANEPDCPVEYNARLNEFSIKDRRGGERSIYHCFFCGGAAPTSKRGSSFATIPEEERERIQTLADGLATLDEVIAKYGPPEDDMPNGHGELFPERDGKPQRGAYYRTLRYSNLSDTAEIDFVDYGPTRGVRMSFHGKYIGAQKT
jgi:hypothetical protein